MSSRGICGPLSEAVARAARERSEQERETQPLAARRSLPTRAGSKGTLRSLPTRARARDSHLGHTPLALLVPSWRLPWRGSDSEEAALR